MKYKRAIEAALNTLYGGAVPVTVEPDERTGERGRPKTKIVVGGYALNLEEHEVYKHLMAFWERAKGRSDGEELMTDEQFLAYQRKMYPALQKRLLELSLVTDDIKGLRAVTSDIADRAFGKAATQINLSVSDKDIRKGWKELEDKSVIDISNLVEFVDSAADGADEAD